MPERFCPNCREPAGDARHCPECGEQMPGAKQAEESGDREPASTPDQNILPPPPPPEDEASPPPSDPDEEPDGDEREPEPYSEFAPPGEFRQSELPEEPLPQQVAHPVAETPSEPGPPPADGQLRCHYCGESAYKGEVLCWACQRRLEDRPGIPEEPEVAEPVVGSMGAPAVGAPESGAPIADPPDASQVDQRAAERSAQAPSGAQPPSEVLSHAWWSFGLGLVSVFTCGVLGLLGVAAIWLGALASRKGAGPMAVAGMVFGALGVLMFLAIVTAAVLLLGGNAGAPPDYVLLLGARGGLS